MITLKRPIVRQDGQTVSTVKPRAYLTAGDVMAARRYSKDDEVLQNFMLVARVCGLDIIDVESMAIEDVEAVSRAFAEEETSDPKADPGP